jgi:hypothetical protein
VRLPHERRSWPELKLHGSSQERGRRGGAGGPRGAVRGAPKEEGSCTGEGHGGAAASVSEGFCYVSLSVRDGESSRRGRRRKGKGKKKKEGKEEKKYGKFSKIDFF